MQGILLVVDVQGRVVSLRHDLLLCQLKVVQVADKDILVLMQEGVLGLLMCYAHEDERVINLELQHEISLLFDM